MTSQQVRAKLVNRHVKRLTRCFTPGGHTAQHESSVDMSRLNQAKRWWDRPPASSLLHECMSHSWCQTFKETDSAERKDLYPELLGVNKPIQRAVFGFSCNFTEDWQEGPSSQDAQLWTDPGFSGPQA